MWPLVPLGALLSCGSPAWRAVVPDGGGSDRYGCQRPVLATRSGSLSVAVPTSSLYPAGTVILARLVPGERLNRWQTAGVICALVAVALIVGGSGW